MSGTASAGTGLPTWVWYGGRPSAITVSRNAYMSLPRWLRVPSGWDWTMTTRQSSPYSRISAAELVFASPLAASVTVGGASLSDRQSSEWSLGLTRTATV